MDKEKVKNFIVSQRANGVPDDQIFSFLQEKGAIPKQQEPVVEKPSVAEKIATFTGGKELAQGLGQALAQGEISKGIEETQKMQTDIQTNLLTKIKEQKALGADTSRLENALALITEDLLATGEGAEKLLNQNELTGKQVIGSALQLGTTLGTIGGLSGAGVKATGTLGRIPGLTKQGTGIATELAGKITGGGVGTLRGAGQGLIAGAGQGAITGALTGASQGLQEDKTGMEILKDAGSGALIGGLAGGVLGTLTGGISGAIKGRDATKLVKQEKNVLDAITPNTKNLSNKEYTKLLDQKRITPKTGTKGSQYILSESEKQTALKYPNLLTKKDPVKNYTAIVNEIAKQDEDVGSFLKQNNGIFNSGELKNSIKNSLVDITDISLDEKVVAKNKQKLIDNFIKGLDKNDMESLWKARKEFDKQIEKAFTGSPTLQNKIKREFRNAVQNFIADRTPDEVYKTSMKEMSNLFKLKDLVNRKALSEKGQSAIRLWMRENPVKTKVIGIGAPALVGGAVLLD